MFGYLRGDHPVQPDSTSPGLYRGRLAPSPTGFLHSGHAQTFRTAQERAVARGGVMVLRVEDLDAGRCRPEFREAIIGDLHSFGLRWDEGPDCGGPFAPYLQSGRRAHYLAAWKKLRAAGWIYPCACSRRDVIEALVAPHRGDDEPVYPGKCRPSPGVIAQAEEPAGINWRFRVPDGEELRFEDGRLGWQKAIAGVDFGDFVVWRKDDIPAYQLAVTVDDAAMRITEVVRGEDLLTSTFRQILIYRALGFDPPSFYHCELVTDEQGRRLAKRHNSPCARAREASRNSG